MDIGQVIVNYVFMQASILLFFAPFIVGYLLTHKEVSLKHIPFNAFAENFLASGWASALIFFWALGEALIWFVIPEFLLLLIIFLKIKNKTRLLVYDLLGTTIGTIIGLLVVPIVHINLLAIPYITQGMIQQVATWYRTFGVFALFFQPFSGVPYKVFVLTVGSYPISPVVFTVLAIIVRIGRYAIFYFIFEGIYPLLHRFVSKNYVPIFILSCFVFSIIFLKVYHSYGGIALP